MGALSNKIKGKAKQIQGRLTGNDDLVTEGSVQQATGEVESAASRVARKVKRGVRRAKAQISRAGRQARTR